MNKKELREQILLNLLVNKFKNEDVTVDLVKKMEEEFHQLNNELEKLGKKAKKNTNVADYFSH